MTVGKQRRRLALLALGAAIVTGGLGVALGDPSVQLRLSASYLILVGAAVIYPALIAVQVVAGQLLVASLLLGAGAAPLWALAPMVAGVVVTAELLAAVARMDTPLERPPSNDLPRAARAAAIGAITFVGVLPFGALPGLPGPAAVVVAAGACAYLGMVLAGARAGVRPRRPDAQGGADPR